MNDRQRRFKARHRFDHLKSYWWAYVLGLALFVAFGLAGREDYKQELYQETITACEAERRDCLDLIREVQKDPNVRVVQDGTGRTWIELKGDK